jgi:capsule biosynthesis phosphatase
MIIIIPLGGIGERFKKNGYNVPKALINVLGKPILYYLLDSIDRNQNIEFIYIPYNNEYIDYRLEDRLKNDYPYFNFKFLALHNNTDGAAHTIKLALDIIDNVDCPIICMDGDNFYTTNIIGLYEKYKDNAIITTIDNSDSKIYSFADVNNNNVINIIEKERISNNICTGVYCFNSYKLLHKYCNKIINNNIKFKNEYYVSVVISEMLKDGFVFKNININKNDWHCLGTPIQVRLFCNNYPRISCLNNNIKIKQKRICFDLDNTLVTYPKILGDYASVEPIQKNIDYLKYLKKFGHTIIIYTARRMKTHNGNIGKINADIGKITFDTLDKFDIPYDEIYFGKPYADIYIDDLAVNCFDNIEKYLGFYNDNIKPRDFNTINMNTIEIYEKKSNDLSGEIYYYLNMPNEIKDLFPILFDYDTNNKWFKMEKISGITVSQLYINQLLTQECLLHIMNSLIRIHNTDIKYNDNINIYDNYCCKLKQRYENYNYNQYDNSNILYNELYQKLLDYETKNKGKIRIIHGDPVFINIIINNYEKIKFIDMRGKINNITTIYGDWLYDWAKLYQSLIGYDNILLEQQINNNYQEQLIFFFKNKFIELYSLEDFNNLKIITQSLLFTLIPLHNNNKCLKYYQLIFSKYLI